MFLSWMPAFQAFLQDRSGNFWVAACQADPFMSMSFARNH
jgi:hypothetical protein